MQRPPEDWIPGYLPGLRTEAAPPEMVEEVKFLMSGVRQVSNQAMLRGMAEADLRDVLGRIDVPHPLHGNQDVRSPVAVGRALHHGIPGSSLVILPGIGHLSNVERAEEFNREVRSLLEKHND